MYLANRNNAISRQFLLFLPGNDYHQTEDDSDSPKPNFVIISDLLEFMSFKDGGAPCCLDDPETFMINIMDDFLQSINVINSLSYLEVFEGLKKLLDTMVSAGVFSSLQFLDDACETVDGQDKSNWTVYSKFCQSYKAKHIERDTKIDNEQDITKEQCTKLWQPYLQIFTSFDEMVKPKLSVKVSEGKSFHALLSLCRAQDDYQGLHYLMDRVVDVDVENEDGLDALYILIERGYLEGVQMLLKKGSNVNRVRTKYNAKGEVDLKDTPLLWALNFGKVDIIRCLIESGASLFTKGDTGTSAVHKAVINCSGNKTKKNLEIVRFILENGADVNETDKDSRTPLHIAVNNGDDKPDSSLDLEMLLLKKGADVTQRDMRGRTPLHYAFVKVGKPFDCAPTDPIQIVGALVENQTSQNINVQDTFGCTALHYSGYRGSTVCSLLLLQHGADIETADLKGQTPLCYAVLGRHDGSTLMLIQKQANINVQVYPFQSKDKKLEDEDNLFKYLPEHFTKNNNAAPQTLFHRIVTNDWLGIIYVMLGKLEEFGIKFIKALEVAFLLQKLQFAKTLLSRVVDDKKLGELTSEGRNLISEMAFQIKGDLNPEIAEDVFEILVSAGLKSDQTDEYHGAPLHYACINHNQTLIKLLLKQNEVLKNVSGKTKRNRNALAAYFWNLKLASKMDTEMIELLLENGLDVDEMFPFPAISFLSGDFSLAAQQTRENFLETTGDEIDVSPLILAVGREDEDLVKFLLDHSADPNLQDSKRRSPLVYALRTNNSAIIQLLLRHIDTGSVDFTTLMHTVAIDPNHSNSPSFDNSNIFKKLLDLVSYLSKDQYTQLARKALSHRASNIFKLVSKFSNTGALKNIIPTENGDMEVGSVNYTQDAKRMLESLQDDLDVEDKAKPGKTQKGCIVKEGSIYEDFDVLLNKVDVSFGAWGLYNFYRAQIWKDKHKGRI